MAGGRLGRGMGTACCVCVCESALSVTVSKYTTCWNIKKIHAVLHGVFMSSAQFTQYTAIISQTDYVTGI